MTLAGLQSSEGLIGAGWSGLAHSHGWQVHVGCWQDDSIVHHMDFTIRLLECSHNMASTIVTDPRKRKRKQGGSDNVFYDLTTEVTLLHFCNVLLVIQISPIPCGKGLYRSVTARRQKSLWPSWTRAATLPHWISEDEIS